ncbi:hypothetical protein EYA84_02030 [Verrucosispora sp. SN26_14.1]|uniref:hypothetical protein n=1 Tax=Verrucosispora sp. SN26_14.1 TaxID=2527879 RepID=UPI001033F615|nr:hypothetical protein [Verrucosispora sp. SN26_14.1]TBL44244.1 hypothetical protein EYA84_02030 [Verrucosispora sp. SN26_14.1]
MSGVEFEHRELDRWVRTLDSAAEDAIPEARKVVQKGALNIKKDAQQRISGLKHAPAYPYAITYDSKETAGGAEAEIGLDKNRRQGALGNILELGTVKNPPRPHMIPAAQAEEPRFEKALADLAERLLRRS